jgi:S-adenosylmethionine synthetase
VMGVRHGSKVGLTVACAMIGKYLAHMDDYLAQIETIRQLTRELAARHGFSDCEIQINAADNPKEGTIYLTVTGTSAEGGDDGQVGRGNRVNGLITPCQPMSLEAAAGKNPVSHVGKLYNVIAQRVCAELVERIPEIASAHCLLVSRIGEVLTEPAVLELKIATHNSDPIDDQLRQSIEDIATDQLRNTATLIDDFIEGRIELF